MPRRVQPVSWVVVGQAQNGDILFVRGPFVTSDTADAWAKRHLTAPTQGSGLRYYITEMQDPERPPE